MRFKIVCFLIISNTFLLIGESGFVINEKDKKPIEFVNIGIVCKGIGTNSKIDGSFNLNIEDQFNNDSIRFSSIGYKPFTIKVSDFRKLENKTITLEEKLYDLKEVVISPRMFKQKTLGYTSHTRSILMGFKKSSLGNECGVMLSIKKTARLDKLNLNFVECTFDTVFLRINFYKIKNKLDFENILSKPIYLNITKKDIKDKITIDLKPYQLNVNGDCLVTLEYVKELGDGHLWFSGSLLGKTYYRKISQDKWQTVPLGICFNVEALVEK